MTCDDIAEKTARIGEILLMLKSLEKRHAFLDGIDQEEEIPAWQADLVPDGNDNKLTVGDTVGLCEIGDDTPNLGVNIRPGFTDKAAYDATRDGYIKNMALLKPFNWLLNFMLQPGVRKFKPRYRHGEITKIDYESDTCGVSVDGAFSLWRLNGGVWDIDLTNFHSSVPIRYLDCDADPFEVGDDVLIEFVDADPNNPQVIGFKDHPKPCPSGEMVFVSFGEYGFIWDVGIDTYHEDLPGIQTYADCISFLSGKTETTKDADDLSIPIAERGFPYQKMFWRMYDDPAYAVYRQDLTGIFHPDFGGTGTVADASNCRELMLWEQTSKNRVYAPDGLSYTQTEIWSSAECQWGTLLPAMTIIITAVWNGLWFVDTSATGYIQPTFGQPGDVDALWNKYICPIDYDISYYPLCSGAEYGNEALGLGDDALRYSIDDDDAGTLVQIFYSVYGPTTRTTVVHAGCCSFPWIDPDTEAEEKDPINQAKNDLFSEAVNDLIEYWFTQNGYADQNIPYADMFDMLIEGNSYPGGCLDGYGTLPYWGQTEVRIGVKIYTK